MYYFLFITFKNILSLGFSLKTFWVLRKLCWTFLTFCRSSKTSNKLVLMARRNKEGVINYIKFSIRPSATNARGICNIPVVKRCSLGANSGTPRMRVYSYKGKKWKRDPILMSIKDKTSVFILNWYIGPLDTIYFRSEASQHERSLQ